MIRASYVPKANSPIGQPGVTIDATGLLDMQRLLRVVNRAINCDPEAGEDLFQVADTLEQAINEAKAVQS